ncbi:unnamed protein product [Closterium sp. NIES-54]
MGSSRMDYGGFPTCTQHSVCSFIPVSSHGIEQVLGLPPSPGPAPSFECPQPVQSQSLLQPVSPLPAPSPYAGPTGGLAERRAPASRPASPARPTCTSRRASRPRPPPVSFKGEVTEVLIDWIRAARLRLRESFGSEFPVLRLHSDRGGEFSSALLGAFCRAQGIRQTFTLPASPQQNGIAERRIGMVMDVARTSMIHAAAPHFLWPFAVQYAAHQLNLQPWVSLPETSPTLLWTGKVGDASAFRVWGSRAFSRDLSADKLSPRAVPCVFLGFPPDAPGWQFYHPTSRRVLSSQDVTFDESVPYYRLFPYRTASLPPPPLFLAPEPVEVAVDSGAAPGAEPAGAGSGGAGSGGAETGGAEPGGAESGGAKPGGAESGGAEPWGAEPGGAATRGTEPGGAEPGGTEPEGAEPGGAGSARVASRGASSRREVLSPQELREWFARRWGCAAGAGGTTAATGSGGTCPGGAGAAGPGGTAEAAGVGPTGVSAGASGGAGVASTAGTGAAGATGVGAAGGVGVGGSADTGTSEGAGAGAAGAGGATGAGAPAWSPGAVLAGSGGAPRPRSYFVPLLEQVLGLPPSPGPAPPFECPQPVQSQSLLPPVSPLPAPSPYTGPTGGLAERRAPASRPASPARPTCTSRRTSRPRPPAVPGTHQMALRPSTAPLRVPPTVARFLATVVTDPSLASTTASALVAELVDFAASCHLDYAASLVAESASVCPPSVGGECALSTDVLEDRQEEFQCFAAALPHLVSTMLAPKGDPDAPDIPTPRSYAEAIEGPYCSQWQAAMDAEMASWKSTGTYVDEVPPPGANIVSGMWIFRVKQPPGSPPVFKACYVARGFSQRQGVDYFQTFSPTPKMTTLRVLLHVAAQRDYELHSLDFSTAFLQGSLHEEIWLRRPPGLTGSFPPGTQLCGDFVIHLELALLCLTGLVFLLVPNILLVHPFLFLHRLCPSEGEAFYHHPFFLLSLSHFFSCFPTFPHTPMGAVPATNSVGAAPAGLGDVMSVPAHASRWMAPHEMVLLVLWHDGTMTISPVVLVSLTC